VQQNTEQDKKNLCVQNKEQTYAWKDGNYVQKRTQNK
jgi:hypothetical protein